MKFNINAILQNLELPGKTQYGDSWLRSIFQPVGTANPRGIRLIFTGYKKATRTTRTVV